MPTKFSQNLNVLKESIVDVKHVIEVYFTLLNISLNDQWKVLPVLVHIASVVNVVDAVIEQKQAEKKPCNDDIAELEQELTHILTQEGLDTPELMKMVSSARDYFEGETAIVSGANTNWDFIEGIFAIRSNDFKFCGLIIEHTYNVTMSDEVRAACNYLLQYAEIAFDLVVRLALILLIHASIRTMKTILSWTSLTLYASTRSNSETNWGVHACSKR